MPDSLGLGAALNGIGVVGICVLATVAFMKEWIVPGRRLRRSEARAEKWEEIALGAMRASTSAILPAAETVHRLVSNLPDPGADAEVEGGSP
jgi:hypothetical protein